MKINKTDPRLTAYLLNELSNEDHVLVEEALRESSEIKEELERLKKGLGLLSKNKPADEDFFKLTNQQRQQIFDQIADSQPNFLQRFIRGPWGYATAGLVTASFALMVFNHSLKDQVTSQKAQMTKDEIVVSEVQKISEAPAATISAAAPAKEKIVIAEDKALGSPAVDDAKPTEFAADQAAASENEMALADSAASAPEPQMAAPAERKKSAAFGAFGGGPTEGATKGAVSNFQKMQKKELADSAGSAGPSSEFLLQTEPAVSQNLREKLHANFQDCLFHPENGLTSFKLKWNGLIISDIEPSHAVTPTQKSCLQEQLKTTLGPKKDILLIKINSVSK